MKSREQLPAIAGVLFVLVAGVGCWPWGPPSPVLQVVHEQTNQFVSREAPIPWDDSRPLVTEGIELLRATIVPKSVTSRLLIEATVHATEEKNSSDHIIVAVFREGQSDALAVATEQIWGNHAEWGDGATNGLMVTIPLDYVMPAAGTTSPVTFILRAGVDPVSGSSFPTKINVNGATGSRRMGGAFHSTLRVTELREP